MENNPHPTPSPDPKAIPCPQGLAFFCFLLPKKNPSPTISTKILEKICLCDTIVTNPQKKNQIKKRLYELSDMLDSKPVCANFIKIGEDECFEPYSIVSYGDVKIAYRGL